MRARILALLYVVAAATTLRAQNTLPAGRADSIDAYVRATMAARGIPGASIAVASNGAVVFERTYRFANVVLVQPTLAGIREGRDEVLEAAFKFLGGKGAISPARHTKWSFVIE
jgi:hypothetical protein